MRFSDKRILVIDRGLFVSWALRLARDFGEVYFHNPSWKQSYPSSKQLLIGHGFDEITMVKNLWDVVHKMDLVVFPDINDGDLQLELVRQGMRVWGSRKGEELEIYRPEAKQEMQRLGMPVGDYEVVTGLESLRDYLKKHRNVHVKISLTRADTETFYSPSYEEIIPKLDEIKHFVGAAADVMQFVVEKPIEPALELGYDGFTIDGGFPKHALNGVEIKDCSYLGVILPYESLDEHIRGVNEWLSPLLEKYQYRGLFSTEVRIGEDEQPYLIDVTCRSGSPPGESMQELIGNWGEIMWHGAAGKLVDPEAEAKYAAQAVICSENVTKAWRSVTIPDEARRWVKLFCHCRLNGVDHVAPQGDNLAEMGWVVGIGDTVKEAIKACKDHADLISGYKLEVRTNALDEAVEEIQKGEKLGIQFSDEKIHA